MSRKRKPAPMAATSRRRIVGSGSAENATPAQQTGALLVGESCTHHYMRMSIGGSNMGERTPNPESEGTPGNKPEAGDAAAGSAAEQAKEREREMEESGEENAA
jgi:hypothetical protein